MSQIAQQDHLFIEIGDAGMDELNNEPLKSELRSIFNEKFKAGTIADCILRNNNGDISKVVAAHWDDYLGTLGHVSVVFEDSIVMLLFSE